MTKQELIQKLSECMTVDVERDHCHADDLLIEYIGDEDIKTAYDKIDKWYA